MEIVQLLLTNIKWRHGEVTKECHCCHTFESRIYPSTHIQSYEETTREDNFFVWFLLLLHVLNMFAAVSVKSIETYQKMTSTNIIQTIMSKNTHQLQFIQFSKAQPIIYLVNCEDRLYRFERDLITEDN